MVQHDGQLLPREKMLRAQRLEPLVVRRVVVRLVLDQLGDGRKWQGLALRWHDGILHLLKPVLSGGGSLPSTSRPRPQSFAACLRRLRVLSVLDNLGHPFVTSSSIASKACARDGRRRWPASSLLRKRARSGSWGRRPRSPSAALSATVSKSFFMCGRSESSSSRLLKTSSACASSA